MIATSLQFIANSLDTFLKQTLSIAENLVIVSRLLQADGTPNEESKNKVLISYLYLEADRAIANMPSRKPGGFDLQESNKAYHLYFMVTMNYENYVESLKLMDIVH